MAAPGRWNSPSHDLKQNLVTAVTIAAEPEEQYMHAIFKSLISGYSLAVQTIQHLLPQGPGGMSTRLGVVSRYEESIEIFTRLYRISALYVEEADRSKAEAERLRQMVMPELLRGRTGDPPDDAEILTPAPDKGGGGKP